jgi:hypothetical protein
MRDRWVLRVGIRTNLSGGDLAAQSVLAADGFGRMAGGFGAGAVTSLGDFESMTPDVSDPVPIARYCARCQRERAAEQMICRTCGEATQPQVYCEVCDDFWMLPAGDLCPKHDVALLKEPPPREPMDDEAASGTKLVTIGAYSTEQAEILRIRLEGEGIPTFVVGERMGSASMLQVATGGVKLQVPQNRATDARILLSQNWSAPTAEDDLDDAWEELAPEPGAFRRRVMKGIVLLIIFGPFVVALLVGLLRHL